MDLKIETSGSCEAADIQVWKNRLATFLKAEKRMRVLHLSSSISISLAFVSAGSLSFTLFLPVVMPIWLFITSLITLSVSLVIFLFFIPLVRASRTHRNDLSRFFFQNDLNVEYFGDTVQLRDRRDSKIICSLDAYATS